MKDVVISMHSIHGLDEDEQQILDFTTDGIYFRDGDTACFSYIESDVTGLEGTRTSVIIMPDHVVVDRDGSVTSRMVFREGEKNTFPYDTPFGMAMLGVKTRRINQSFNDRGGKLEVDYIVDMEHVLVERNKIELSVREQRGM
ncbi:MAG: DUF1934 domain-containing protein [Eubacteriales bacterium]|nr:DUF1934 domain-containing protein [Eubacteriales bacterium]